MDTTLAVKNLSIGYSGRSAVQDISFDVRPGEIFGLLGPNGAGKTSTLSAIEGLLRPQAGTITVAGFDIVQHPLEARMNLGVQLQTTSFQGDLNVFEIIKLYAGLYGLRLTDEAIMKIIFEIRLEDSVRKTSRQLSGGQLQRLALSIASLHNPPLLLLDEPTTGLDPQSRRQLWERIEAIRDQGRAVLLTTHSMEEARAVCDRTAIMDHGKILVINSPQNLVNQHKNDPDVIAVSRRGEVTLEDVFIALTGRAVRK